MPTARTRTARHRGAPPQRVSQDPFHAPKEVIDEKGMPYVVGRSLGDPWCPSTRTMLLLLLTVRFSGVMWSIISDCDETFNYWEPLHFFLYDKGFQTWEYSPEFALRSYLYILVHTVPAWIYNVLLGPLPMNVFVFVRLLLAIVASVSEAYFITGILKEAGSNVARLTMAFMILSSGMFGASVAFLPSTTSMFLTSLSYGSWFRRKYELAILFTALSAFLSWPFAAVIGFPIAIDIFILRRKYKYFIKWCLISALVTLLPQVIIDSQYYGKLVIAPWNIVKYNIFTSHGPDLYGTEDWKFYFFNGFLNFNIVFLLSLFLYPVLFLCQAFIPNRTASRYDIPHWVIFLGMFLWIGIFFSQPHKEERFLFPIYPLIALAGAFVLDMIQKMYFRFFVEPKNRHYLEHTNWLSVLTLIVFTFLSSTRILAIYQNYSAPISIWRELAYQPFMTPGDFQPGRQVNVCIGKEWHRFPSSFFLPNQDWNLKFLKSEFRGQLPQPYLSGEEDGTRIVRPTFNDLNREEMNRYEIKSLDQCDFLVDLDKEKVTDLEPRYGLDKSRWQVLESFPFLIPEESHKVLRAFHIPFVSSKYCKFADYVLLKNKKPYSSRKKKRNL